MAERDRPNVAQRRRINEPQLSLFEFEERYFIVVYSERTRKFMGDFGCVLWGESIGLTLIGKLGERQCG